MFSGTYKLFSMYITVRECNIIVNMYANCSLINYGRVSTPTEEKSGQSQNDASTCGSQCGQISELDTSLVSSTSILDESSVRKKLIHKALNREYVRGSLTNRSGDSRSDSKPPSKQNTSRQSVNNPITEGSPISSRGAESTPTKCLKSPRLKSANSARAPLSPPRMKTPGRTYRNSPASSPIAPKKDGSENQKSKVIRAPSPSRKVGSENVNPQRSKTPMPRLASPKSNKFNPLTPVKTPAEERDLSKYSESPDKTDIVEKMIFQAIELQILLEPSINQIRDFFKTLFKNLESNVDLPASLLENIENIMKTFSTYKKSRSGREIILMEDILNELYEFRKTRDRTVLPIIRANLKALVSFIEDEESLAMDSSLNNSSSQKMLFPKSSSSPNLLDLHNMSPTKLEMTLGKEKESEVSSNCFTEFPESKLRQRLESAFQNELRISCTPKFSDLRSAIALRTEMSASDSSYSIIQSQFLEENPLSTRQISDNEENLLDTFNSASAMQSYLETDSQYPLYYNQEGCYDCSFGIIKLQEVTIDSQYRETRETITLGSIDEIISEIDESSMQVDTEFKLSEIADEETEEDSRVPEVSLFRDLNRSPEKSIIKLQLIPEASQEASPECESIQEKSVQKEIEIFQDVEISQRWLEIPKEEPVSIFETIRQAFHQRSQSSNSINEIDQNLSEDRSQVERHVRNRSFDLNSKLSKSTSSIPKPTLTSSRSVSPAKPTDKAVLRNKNTPEKKARIEEELTRFLQEKLDIINIRKNKSQDLLVQKRKILLDKRTEIMTEFRTKLQSRDDNISPTSRDRIISQFSQEDLYKATSARAFKKVQEQEKLREKSSQLKRNHQQLQRDREKLQRLLERYKKK